MTGFRLFTLRHWSLVVGVIVPLLVAVGIDSVRHRVVLGASGVSPWYPVILALGMGVPPLLLLGTILSYALRWPHSNGARFGLGFALGATLLVLSQTQLMHF